MLHLIFGTDWTVNRNEVLTRIRRDVHMRRGGRVLLVPELVSHETERLLCETAGDTASRYAEVLSFTRLARRVSDDLGCGMPECLDAGGRVVAMASAARQLHSRLKAYAPAETRPEFLTGLIDAVDEFKRCRITSADLAAASQEASGSLAQKLEELALLLESYDAVCSRGRRDPREQEALLLEQLQAGEFAENHIFYIDGFPDFTRQHLAILEHILCVSPEVTVSVNCDCPGSPRLAFEKAGDTASQLLRLAHRAGVEVKLEPIPAGNTPLEALRAGLFQGSLTRGCLSERLHVCQAETPMQECFSAAEKISEFVRGGCRYRDITVVCADFPGYRPLLELAFHRFGIPVYCSGTESILQKSVIATVLSAMDAALDGFERRDVLRYLRSVLSPIAPDTCDRMENYAVVWGIRGNQWLKPWENHPDGLSGEWDEQSRQRLAALNVARESAMRPLENLVRGFREAGNLAQQVSAVCALLDDLELERRIAELAAGMDAAGDNRSAQILNQLWEILIGALEQLHDVLGDTVWDANTFTRLLQLLLSQYNVGTIPPVLDAVQVGAISAQRLHAQKHLLVLGAQEGNLPAYSGSSGVLTDQERTALRKLGVPLTGGAMEGIQAEFAEIYGVFCGAEETVTLWYSGSQPSFICRRLAVMVGGEELSAPGPGAALHERAEAGAYLARWNARADAQMLGLTAEYEETCRRRDYLLGTVERPNIEGLYGKRLNLSASQIDRQAECRLSYFLRYGLRAKERKEASVDPAEFGSYVHAVLEKTARRVNELGGFPVVSLEQTLEIAEEASQEYAEMHFSALGSERTAYLFRRNAQELRAVVRELWEELRASQFQPVGFEVSFGGEGGLPVIPIPAGSMRAVLRGFVDRVDVWQRGGDTYYRVVDYKTGKKEFDYCDIFNGVGLQMLLYLFALEKNGAVSADSQPIPAGVQYFPARAPYLSVDGRADKAALEKQRDKLRRRQGLLLRDENVLRAMEPNDERKLLSCARKKDGTLIGDLADREQLRLLRAYIFRFLGCMVDEIASGNVRPNPYTRGSSHSACAFCPFGAVCRDAGEKGRRNYQAMTAQWFWEEIAEEMKSNG